MSGGKHTTERLVLTSQNDEVTGCASFESRQSYSPDTIVLYHDNAKEDARRIVACWNACMGLSTEALERLGTLDKARVELDVLRARLMSERDELEEALQLMLEQFTKTPSTLKDSEARIKAHAALSRATGSKS